MFKKFLENVIRSLNQHKLVSRSGIVVTNWLIFLQCDCIPKRENENNTLQWRINSIEIITAYCYACVIFSALGRWNVFPSYFSSSLAVTYHSSFFLQISFLQKLIIGKCINNKCKSLNLSINLFNLIQSKFRHSLFNRALIVYRLSKKNLKPSLN